MPIKDNVAVILGLAIAIAAALLARGVRDNQDESMRWEGGVAVGFTALIVLGPVWIAQLVLTILATFDGAGWPVGWLWAWLFLAPLVGMSGPATGPGPPGPATTS